MKPAAFKLCNRLVFDPALDEALHELYPSEGTRPFLDRFPQYTADQIRRRAGTLGLKMTPEARKRANERKPTTITKRVAHRFVPDLPEAEVLALHRRWA